MVDSSRRTTDLHRHVDRTSCQSIALVALLAFTFAVVFTSPAAAARSRTLTVYSVATGVQYLDNADDRARGALNNPFGSGVNKLDPYKGDRGQGPFPGDVGVYSLNLYVGPTLKQSAGSAVYTCYFNYARHAFCEAYYVLKQGAQSSTLVASGPVNFNETGFTIVVTGGTKSYLGARGEVRVATARPNTQVVDFRLLS